MYYNGFFKKDFFFALFLMLSFPLCLPATASNNFSSAKFKVALELKYEAENSIYKFFLNRGFTPFWITNQERVSSLLRAIDLSDEHGLPRSRYSEKQIKKEYKELKYYQIEIRATETLLKLISDLYSGVVDPEILDDKINVKASKIDHDFILDQLETNLEIDKFIYSFAPKLPEYKNLMLEKRRLEGVIAENGWGGVVPEGKFLGFNLVHPNVKILRSRLNKMGYLAHDTGSERYDAELRSSVQLFQADFGLNDDGVAGEYTLQAINISPQTRLIQTIVNLERMRWSRFPKRSKYILVNQPNFHAYFFEEGEIVWQSRIVIGLPDHQTVEFNDTMTHMIINPTWHVPRSISIEEYLPIIQEDPNFLVDNEMVLLVRGTDTKIDPSLIDMSKFESNNFPFEIKQLPSNVNALGVVKFMFPNKHNIYMHDTPMKELFFKDERTFSHGCVRLQDPFQFAYQLLKSQVSSPEVTFQSLLSTKRETQINLKDAIPVNITYRTVFFDNYGQPQYRADIYGRDALLFMALQDAGLNKIM